MVKPANFSSDWSDLTGGALVVGVAATSLFKTPVRVATTVAGTLATSFENGDTIDGVVLATGDRILIKNQASAIENGIYVVNASGAPTRATDADTGAEVFGLYVGVALGTTNTGKLFRNTNTTVPVLGTDGVTFAEFSAATLNAELNIEGGQSVIKAHGSMGATETFDPTDGNVHTGTLDANLTVTLNVPTGTGAATLELWITQDGTGGRTITWPGSVTGSVSPDTTAGVTVRYILETIDGGTNWLLNLVGGGTTSPLTTKGDVWGYSTVNARVPIGSNNQLLTADSAQALGLKWGQGPLTTTGDLLLGATGGTPTRLAIGASTYVLTSDGTTAAWAASTGGVHEVVMVSGSSPPDPVLNSAGDDWIYS